MKPKAIELAAAEVGAAWDSVRNDETYQQVANEVRGLGFEREGSGLHRVEWNGSTWHLVTTTFTLDKGEWIEYGYVFTPVERTDDGWTVRQRTGDSTATTVGVAAKRDDDQVNIHSIIPRTGAAPMILGLVTALAHFDSLMGCSFEDWGLLCAMEHFGLGVFQTRLTPELHVQESVFFPGRSASSPGRSPMRSKTSGWTVGGSVRTRQTTTATRSPGAGPLRVPARHSGAGT